MGLVVHDNFCMVDYFGQWGYFIGLGSPLVLYIPPPCRFSHTGENGGLLLECLQIGVIFNSLGT